MLPKAAKKFAGTGFAFVGLAVALVMICSIEASAQGNSRSATNQMAVLEIEGTVEVSRSKSPTWDPAYVNQLLHGGDRVRTRERSRAVVRLSQLTTWRLDQLSVLELPVEPQPRSLFNLLRGALYFFHRDVPGTFPVKTPTMSAIVRGTEFVLRVEEDGTSTLVLLDGEVEVSNDLGQLRLISGEAATAAPGKPPVKTAVIESVNVVQWALYYPGVLDLADLQLGEAVRGAISDSLDPYAAGDLLRAVTAYPAERKVESAEERLYLAALLLSVGRVDESEELLGGMGTNLTSVATRSVATNRQECIAGALRKIVTMPV